LIADFLTADRASFRAHLNPLREALLVENVGLIAIELDAFVIVFVLHAANIALQIRLALLVQTVGKSMILKSLQALD
jgi:hypothetical protein